MNQFFLRLALLAGLCAAPLVAQTPDSVQTRVKQHTDSIKFYTRVVSVPSKPDTIVKRDTLFVQAPLPSGVDTLRFGRDSLQWTAWHTGRINDSARVVVIPQPIKVGRFFGTYGRGLAKADTESFTLSSDSQTPQTLALSIAKARAAGYHLILAMTGGNHDNYLTNGVFDRAKWDAKMDSYNTPDFKALIAGAVTDGTVIGANAMDEPHVYGLGDGNTWGPKGTMTKARVDSLCGYVRAMFPTLPTGVAHPWSAFEPTKSYKACQFTINQYSVRSGNLQSWIAGALAMGQRDSHGIMFSMNPINGGDRVLGCPKPATGGPGSTAPNCGMRPDQIVSFGKALLDATCSGLLMWRYDDVFMAVPGNKAAFAALAAYAATLPATSCTTK